MNFKRNYKLVKSLIYNNSNNKIKMNNFKKINKIIVLRKLYLKTIHNYFIKKMIISFQWNNNYHNIKYNKHKISSKIFKNNKNQNNKFIIQKSNKILTLQALIK